MARSSKTVAAVISFDERLFGSFRAVNYGYEKQLQIAMYRDSAPRQAVWMEDSWESVELWCSENA